MFMSNDEYNSVFEYLMLWDDSIVSFVISLLVNACCFCEIAGWISLLAKVLLISDAWFPISMKFFCKQLKKSHDMISSKALLWRTEFYLVMNQWALVLAFHDLPLQMFKRHHPPSSSFNQFFSYHWSSQCCHELIELHVGLNNKKHLFVIVTNVTI